MTSSADSSVGDGRPEERDRVAIVVVSGVGDDALGDGRDLVARALLTDQDGRWTHSTPGTTTLLATAEPDRPSNGPHTLNTGTDLSYRRTFPVPTARVTADGVPDVDIYEMYWADISRAQGPIRRVFYLLMAITLQVATIGLEAVRRYAAQSHTSGGTRYRILRVAMNALSYWMVYAITPITLAMATLALAVNGQLLSPTWFDHLEAILIAAAAVGVAATWWIAGRLYRGGWTFDRVDDDSLPHKPWLISGALAAVAAAPWVAGTDHSEIKLQLSFLLAWPALLIIVAHTLSLTGSLQRRRLVQLYCAAIPLAAALLALVDERHSASQPAKTADALTQIALGSFRLVWIVALALCTAIAAMATWVRFRRGREGGDERRRLSTTAMLTVALGPLLYSITTTGIFVFFSLAARGYPQRAREWPPGGAPAEPGPHLFDPIGPDRVPSSTRTWGEEIVLDVVQPLGLALLYLAIPTLVIGAVAFRYARSLARRGGATVGAQASIDQGRSLDRVFRFAGGHGMFLGAQIAWIVVVTAAAVTFWATGSLTDAGDWLGRVGFWTVLVFVAAAAGGIALRNVPWLARLGAVVAKAGSTALDLVYDISSYLRIGQPGFVPPRVQMVARYRAVLTHLRRCGYQRTVVVAHSQGTMLSIATVLGDDDRLPPLPAADPSELPLGLEFLSFGSPLRQTYQQRFPGQFTHVQASQAGPSPRFSRWYNVYRAGDFVGRFLSDGGSYDPRQGVDGPIAERCIGTGQHTAYLTDERWRRILRSVAARNDGQVTLTDIGPGAG